MTKVRKGRPLAAAVALTPGEMIKVRLEVTEPWEPAIIDSVDTKNAQIFAVNLSGENYQFALNEYPSLITHQHMVDVD